MLKRVAIFMINLALRAVIFLLIFYTLAHVARVYLTNQAFNRVESSIDFDDTLPTMGQ